VTKNRHPGSRHCRSRTVPHRKPWWADSCCWSGSFVVNRRPARARSLRNEAAGQRSGGGKHTCEKADSGQVHHQESNTSLPHDGPDVDSRHGALRFLVDSCSSQVERCTAAMDANDFRTAVACLGTPSSWIQRICRSDRWLSRWPDWNHYEQLPSVSGQLVALLPASRASIQLRPRPIESRSRAASSGIREVTKTGPEQLRGHVAARQRLLEQHLWQQCEMAEATVSIAKLRAVCCSGILNLHF